MINVRLLVMPSKFGLIGWRGVFPLALPALFALRTWTPAPQSNRRTEFSFGTQKTVITEVDVIGSHAALLANPSTRIRIFVSLSSATALLLTYYWDLTTFRPPYLFLLCSFRAVIGFGPQIGRNLNLFEI